MRKKNRGEALISIVLLSAVAGAFVWEILTVRPSNKTVIKNQINHSGQTVSMCSEKEDQDLAFQAKWK